MIVTVGTHGTAPWKGAYLWILALANQCNKESAVLVCRFVPSATLLCIRILHPRGRRHVHVEIQGRDWEHPCRVRRRCVGSCGYSRGMTSIGSWVLCWCCITASCWCISSRCCTRRRVWIHRCICSLTLLSKVCGCRCSGCCCCCTTANAFLAHVDCHTSPIQVYQVHSSQQDFARQSYSTGHVYKYSACVAFRACSGVNTGLCDRAVAGNSKPDTTRAKDLLKICRRRRYTRKAITTRHDTVHRLYCSLEQMRSLVGGLPRGVHNGSTLRLCGMAVERSLRRKELRYLSGT